MGMLLVAKKEEPVRMNFEPILEETGMFVELKTRGTQMGGKAKVMVSANGRSHERPKHGVR